MDHIFVHPAVKMGGWTPRPAAGGAGRGAAPAGDAAPRLFAHSLGCFRLVGALSSRLREVFNVLGEV